MSRTQARAVGILLALAALLAVYLFWAFGRWPSLVVESRYARLVDAVDAGERERGWLPDFVPSSAFDLREMHDLKSNWSWGTFSYRNEDLEKLRAILVAQDSACTLVVAAPPADDWPIRYEGRICCAELTDAGWKMMTFTQRHENTADRMYVVALSVLAGRAVYWAGGQAEVLNEPCLQR